VVEFRLVEIDADGLARADAALLDDVASSSFTMPVSEPTISMLSR
jgi:hypothetical protein